MNITLEHLPQCQATLHVEVPPEAVTSERESITRAFVSQAKIRGYRPGRAPVSLIESRFKKDIQEELESRLLNRGFNEGVRKEDLKVISITGLKDQAFHNDNSFSFTAQLLLAPAFDLPEYKGIEVRVPRIEISDAEIDRTLEGLRERFADFVDVEGRPLATGDYAVIRFAATYEGQPLADSIPKNAAHIAANDDYWIRIDEESFLPGFCAALVGAIAGETRTVPVTLPADFPLSTLAGKGLVYEVTVKEIKEQKLPELDDEFAGKLEAGKTLAELRERIRESLVTERQRANDAIKTEQIIAFLDEQLDFDLPAELVTSETRRQVNDIVVRSQQSGMDEQQIRARQDDIIHSASHQAALNVKTTFILEEIAAKENIEPSEQELMYRIAHMAAQYQMPLKKIIRELKQSNGLERVRNSLRISKTLDFLRSNASVQEIDPPSEPPADPA